jgi:hypothetical protein
MKEHILKSFLKLLLKPTIFTLLVIVLFACTKDKEGKTNHKEVSHEKFDTTSVLLKYNETVFTIPSPYQATYTIRERDIDFNKDLLNPVENYKNYTSSFKQALNIGVYGTDLGYLNLYDHTTEGISYFSAIKRLSGDLGISDVINQTKIHNIERNLENKDSLMYFLSNTYRLFDSYLKSNNRTEVGALIIAGGWIESIYILSQTLLQTDDRVLVNRLGEQKHPLNNLIELLSSYYYDSEKYTNFIDALVDLAYEFDGIIYNYYYEEPEVYPDKNLTVIKSKSTVVISEYHLRTIANKVAKLRQNIIE